MGTAPTWSPGRCHGEEGAGPHTYSSTSFLASIFAITSLNNLAFSSLWWGREKKKTP